MFDKIVEIIEMFTPLVWLAISLGIVAVVFVIGLIASAGGELGQFKKAARKALKKPSFESFQLTARELPTRARKQYKRARKTGEKPGDVITVDACVYSPYSVSAAARFPGAVMAAGLLSVLLSVFAVNYAKGVDEASLYTVPLLVTAGVMVLRLLAGLVASSVLRGGIKVYNKYIEKLDECMAAGPTPEPQPAVEPIQEADIPFVRPDEPIAEPVTAEREPMQEPIYEATQAYGDTFDSERIEFEPVEEEQIHTAEPVVEPVVTVTPAESEARIKAKARAEAIERARAEAAAKAAAREQAAQAEAARAAQAKAAQTQTAEPVEPAQSGSDSASEVINRIEQISREGAPLSTMKEVALLLQKERAKPENKTPEQQRKLNEALATLLKAMSAANRK